MEGAATDKAGRRKTSGFVLRGAAQERWEKNCVITRLEQRADQ